MRIEPLAKSHDLDSFDCGDEALNTFLYRDALVNAGAGGCRTYVAADDERVVGFYSIAAGSVAHADSPPRVRAGMARHRIPILVLARFAVDRSCQKRGIGRGLLKDAFIRAMRAAEIVGVRALLVHAKDDAARSWYRRQAEFEVSSPEPLQLVILMKDIRRMMR